MFRRNHPNAKRIAALTLALAMSFQQSGIVTLAGEEAQIREAVQSAETLPDSMAAQSSDVQESDPVPEAPAAPDVSVPSAPETSVSSTSETPASSTSGTQAPSSSETPASSTSETPAPSTSGTSASSAQPEQDEAGENAGSALPAADADPSAANPGNAGEGSSDEAVGSAPAPEQQGEAPASLSDPQSGKNDSSETGDPDAALPGENLPDDGSAKQDPDDQAGDAVIADPDHPADGEDDPFAIPEDALSDLFSEDSEDEPENADALNDQPAAKTVFETYRDEYVIADVTADEAAGLPSNAELHVDYIGENRVGADADASAEAYAALVAAIRKDAQYDADTVCDFIPFDIYFTSETEDEEGNVTTERIEPAEGGTVTVDIEFVNPLEFNGHDTPVRTTTVLHETGQFRPLDTFHIDYEQTTREIEDTTQAAGSGTSAEDAVTADNTETAETSTPADNTETADASMSADNAETADSSMPADNGDSENSNQPEDGGNTTDTTAAAESADAPAAQDTSVRKKTVYDVQVKSLSFTTGSFSRFAGVVEYETDAESADGKQDDAGEETKSPLKNLRNSVLRNQSGTADNGENTVSDGETDPDQTGALADEALSDGGSQILTAAGDPEEGSGTDTTPDSPQDISVFVTKFSIQPSERVLHQGDTGYIADPTYLVKSNKEYKLKLVFQENEDSDNREDQFGNTILRYTIPEGFYIPNPVTADSPKVVAAELTGAGEGGADHTVYGSWYIENEKTVVFTWHLDTEADRAAFEHCHNTFIELELEGKFKDDVAIISWGPDVPGYIYVDRERSITYTKNAVKFNSRDNTMEYVIELTSHGVNTDVEVTDLISESARHYMVYDDSSFWVEGYDDEIRDVSEEKGIEIGTGFCKMLPELEDEQTVKIHYAIKLQNTNEASFGSNPDNPTNGQRIYPGNKETTENIAKIQSNEFIKSDIEAKCNLNGKISIDNVEKRYVTTKTETETENGVEKTYSTITWQARVYSRPEDTWNAGGKTITDTLSYNANFTGPTEYYGDVTVQILDANGTSVGDPWVEPISATDDSWSIVLPEENENNTHLSEGHKHRAGEAEGNYYIYTFTYQTRTDVTEQVDTPILQNTIQGPNQGIATAGVGVGPKEINEFDIKKEVASIDPANKTVTWRVILTIPGIGMDGETKLTEYLPVSKDGDKDTRISWTIPSTGQGALLVGEECKEVEDTTEDLVLKFYKTLSDGVKTEGLLPSLDGKKREIYVEIVTKCDDNWLEKWERDLTEDYMLHTNRVELVNQKVRRDASAKAAPKPILKKSMHEDTSDESGFPTYICEVAIYGALGNTSVKDTFDERLEYVLGSRNLRVKDGRDWPFTDSEIAVNPMEFSFNADAKNFDGSPSYIYTLSYKIRVKEGSLGPLVTEALTAPDNIVKLTNTAECTDFVSNTAHVDYIYKPLHKTFVNQSEVNAANRKAQFKIEINREILDLDENSDWLVVPDVYDSTLSVDFNSVQVIEEDAQGNKSRVYYDKNGGRMVKEAGAQSYWDASGNSLTFTVPDGKYVTILYDAYVSGWGVLDIDNTATVVGQSDKINVAMDFGEKGTAGGTAYAINIKKYVDGDMTMPLKGVSFEYWKQDPAHPDTKPSTVMGICTTNDAGIARIEGLKKKTYYCFQEIEDPDIHNTYRLDPTVYRFQISADGTTDYSTYTYKSNDVMTVRNETIKTSIPVRKVWKGGEPAAGTTITYTLWASYLDENGNPKAGPKTEKESKTVGAAENWSCTFTNLDRRDDSGKTILYSVTESDVEGYISDGGKLVDDSRWNRIDKGVVFTNTKIGDKGFLLISKEVNHAKKEGEVFAVEITPVPDESSSGTDEGEGTGASVSGAVVTGTGTYTNKNEKLTVYVEAGTTVMVQNLPLGTYKIVEPQGQGDGIYSTDYQVKKQSVEEWTSVSADADCTAVLDARDKVSEVKITNTFVPEQELTVRKTIEGGPAKAYTTAVFQVKIKKMKDADGQDITPVYLTNPAAKEGMDQNVFLLTEAKPITLPVACGTYKVEELDSGREIAGYTFLDSDISYPASSGNDTSDNVVFGDWDDKTVTIKNTYKVNTGTLKLCKLLDEPAYLFAPEHPLKDMTDPVVADKVYQVIVKNKADQYLKVTQKDVTIGGVSTKQDVTELVDEPEEATVFQVSKNTPVTIPEVPIGNEEYTVIELEKDTDGNSVMSFEGAYADYTFVKSSTSPVFASVEENKETVSTITNTYKGPTATLKVGKKAVLDIDSLLETDKGRYSEYQNKLEGQLKGKANVFTIRKVTDQTGGQSSDPSENQSDDQNEDLVKTFSVEAGKTLELELPLGRYEITEITPYDDCDDYIFKSKSLILKQGESETEYSSTPVTVILTEADSLIEIKAENTYEKARYVAFYAQKAFASGKLTDEETSSALANNCFTFIVKEGRKEVARAKSDTSGNVRFEISYKPSNPSVTEPHTVTHTYTVSEVVPRGGVSNGIVYDTRTYTVNVNVTEGPEGITNAEIVDESASSLTFTNTPVETNFVKQNDSGQILPGATLDLVSEPAGKPVDVTGRTSIPWTSSSDPKVIKGLRDGNYRLKEVAAPAGFYPMDIIFTVTDGVISLSDEMKEHAAVTETAVTGTDGTTENVQTLIMKNHQTHFTVQKTDNETGRGLAGAALSIYKKDDFDFSAKQPKENAKPVLKSSSDTERWSWTSEISGRLVTGLDAGEYVLYEASEGRPAGYEAIEPFCFTLKADNTIIYDKTQVETVYYKSDRSSVPQIRVAGNAKSASGMIITAADTRIRGHVEIEKSITAGETGLLSTDATKRIVKVTKKIRTGTETSTEINTISASEEQPLNRQISFDLYAYSTVDESGNPTNGTCIASGLKTDRNGGWTSYANNIDSFTINEIMESFAMGLPEGKYYIQETAVSDDMVDSGEVRNHLYKFEVPNPAQTIPEGKTRAQAETKTESVTNPLFRGSVTLRKYDMDSKPDPTPLDNVKFRLTKTDGPSACRFTVEGMTGIDGELKFENLPKGTYTLEEIGNTGYNPDDNGFKAEIRITETKADVVVNSASAVTQTASEPAQGDSGSTGNPGNTAGSEGSDNADKPVTLSKGIWCDRTGSAAGSEEISGIGNKRIPGSFSLTKGDGTKKLNGVQFKLKRTTTEDQSATWECNLETGKTYRYNEGTTGTGTEQYIVEDSTPSVPDGELTVTNLPWGTYELTEKQTVPGHVRYDKNEVIWTKTFTVGRNQQKYSFDNVINDPTRLVIEKKAANFNGKGLSDAKFSLYGQFIQDGQLQTENETKEYTTNGDGLITIPDGILAVGKTYTLTETRPPRGYQYPDENDREIQFKINEYGKVVCTDTTHSHTESGYYIEGDNYKVIQRGQNESSNHIVMKDDPINFRVEKWDVESKQKLSDVGEIWFEIIPEKVSSTGNTITDDMYGYYLANGRHQHTFKANLDNLNALLVYDTTYLVKEVQAPYGYQMPAYSDNARYLFRIVVDSTGNVTLSTDTGNVVSETNLNGTSVTTISDSQSSGDTGSGTTTETSINGVLVSDTKLDPIALTKVDGSTPLKDVEFLLKTEPQKTFKNGRNSFRLKTDQDGELCLAKSLDATVGTDGYFSSSDTGTKLVEQLRVGDVYTLEEIENSNPLYKSASVKFKLDPSGKIIVVGNPENANTRLTSSDKVLKIEDIRKPTVVTLTKKDAETNSAIARVEFSLWEETTGSDAVKTFIRADGTKETGNSAANYTTGNDGKISITFSGEQWGSYYLQEEKADGYIIKDASSTPKRIPFKVGPQGVQHNQNGTDYTFTDGLSGKLYSYGLNKVYWNVTATNRKNSIEVAKFESIPDGITSPISDAHLNKALDVTFTLYRNKAGESNTWAEVQTVTAAQKGKAVIEGLIADTLYRLVETTAPKGFALPEEESARTVYFKVDEKGVISGPLNSDGSDPSQSGDAQDSAAGDASGTAVNVAPRFRITAKAGNSGNQILMTDEPILMSLKKEDKIGNALSGAEFTITSDQGYPTGGSHFADGSTEKTISTGETGSVSLDRMLVCGCRYIVKEKTAPYGYQMHEGEKLFDFEVDASGVVSRKNTGNSLNGTDISLKHDRTQDRYVFTVKDEPLKLEFVKEDLSDSRRKLNGVVFTLTTEANKTFPVKEDSSAQNSNGVPSLELVSNENGKLQAVKQKNGSDLSFYTDEEFMQLLHVDQAYTLTEDSNPDPLYKKMAPVSFRIGKDGKMTVNSAASARNDAAVDQNGLTLHLKNERKLTDVQLTKTDIESPAGIEGVIFSLYRRTSNGEMEKLHITESAGARTETTGSNAKNYSTAAGGILSVTGLDWGNYELREETATGYELPADNKIKFEIGPDTNTDTSYTCDTKDSSGRIKWNLQSVTNKKNMLKIRKTDLNGSPLPGASFELYRITLSASSNPGGQESLELYASSASVEGKCKLDPNDEVTEYTIRGIPDGDYVLKETKAPDGYELHSEQQSIRFTMSTTGEITLHSSVDEDTAVLFANDTKSNGIQVKDIPIEIAVLKTSMDQSPVALPGAQFRLDQLKDDGTVSHTKNYTSDTQGRITFSGTDSVLPVVQNGIYLLTETKAPAGYVLSNPAPSVRFKVNVDGTITFVDASGKALENQAASLVFADKSTITMNAETKDAITVTNRKTELRVRKLDNETGASLAGAELEIYRFDDFDLSQTGRPRNNKTPVATWTSSSSEDNREWVVRGLDAGSYNADPSQDGKHYVLYEKTPPAGYEAFAPVEFVLHSDNSDELAGSGTDIVTLYAINSDHKKQVTVTESASDSGSEGAGGTGSNNDETGTGSSLRYGANGGAALITAVDTRTRAHFAIDKDIVSAFSTALAAPSEDLTERSLGVADQSGTKEKKRAGSLNRENIAFGLYWQAGEQPASTDQKINTTPLKTDELGAWTSEGNDAEFLDPAYRPSSGAWTKKAKFSQGLPAGKYYLKETASTEDLLYDETARNKLWAFEIGGGGAGSSDNSDGNSDGDSSGHMSTQTVRVENVLFGARIEVTKLDADALELGEVPVTVSGAEFMLYGKPGTPVADISLTGMTDSNGRIIFSNLPKGTYVLEESRKRVASAGQEGYDLEGYDLEGIRKEDSVPFKAEIIITDEDFYTADPNTTVYVNSETAKKKVSLPASEQSTAGQGETGQSAEGQTGNAADPSTVDKIRLISGSWNQKNENDPLGILNYRKLGSVSLVKIDGESTERVLLDHVVFHLQRKKPGTVGDADENYDNYLTGLETGRRYWDLETLDSELQEAAAQSAADDGAAGDESQSAGQDGSGAQHRAWLVQSGDPGKLWIGNLPWGTYRLVEVRPHDGYSITDPDGIVTRSEDFTITRNALDRNLSPEGSGFRNYKTGLILRKSDLEGAVRLEGAEFELSGVFVRLENGVEKSVEDTLLLTTDETGQVRLHGELIAGERYTLKEVKAPEGYELLTQTLTFTMGDDGSLKDLSAVDETGQAHTVSRIQAGASGSGQDAASDGERSPAAVPEEGFSLQNNYYAPLLTAHDTMIRVSVEKADAQDGKLLGGAEYAVTPAADSRFSKLAGNAPQILLTDENREHALDGMLLPGNSYVLTETKAPAGYELAAPVTFAIDVHGDVTFLTDAVFGPGLTAVDHASVRAYPDQAEEAREQTAQGDAGGTEAPAESQRITVTDPPLKVSLTKADLDDPKHTPLAGAQFTLVPEKGSAFAAGTQEKVQKDPSVVPGVATSTEAMTITTKREAVVLDRCLIAGNTYTLTETKAPEGHTISSPAPSVTFVVEADGTLSFIQKKVQKGEGSITGEGTAALDADGTAAVIFTDPKTAVKISKVDAVSGNVLEKAQFQILDSKGEAVDTWTSGKEPHEVRGLLTEKTYRLHETKAPEGYLLMEDVNFRIDVHGKITTSMKTDASGTLLAADDPASVSVEKIDVANNKSPLSGATLQLLDPAGNEVGHWESSAQPKVFTNLKTDTEYRIHELQIPGGYESEPNGDLTFRVDSSGKVTITNDTGELKTDGTIQILNAPVGADWEAFYPERYKDVAGARKNREQETEAKKKKKKKKGVAGKNETQKDAARSAVRTGDETPLMAWMLLMAAALAGALLLAVMLRRRRHDRG